MNFKGAKQTRKRKQKRRKVDAEVDDRLKFAEKLKAKYGKLRKAEDEVPLAFVNFETLDVVHPSSYERQIGRAAEAHLNRLMQPGQPENVVQSAWLCALCQHMGCFKQLGELYGPYYVAVKDLKTPLPNYLVSGVDFKDNKLKKKNDSLVEESEPLSLDLWFHGDCALWAADLQLLGGRFVALAKFMSKYWKQKCKICSKFGASISVNQQPLVYVHYPCAVEKEYFLNNLTFSCKSSVGK